MLRSLFLRFCSNVVSHTYFLQELGDFQNWSQVIECDMKSIHEALEFVKNVDKQKEDLL
jgi:hypothetical protein